MLFKVNNSITSHESDIWVIGLSLRYTRGEEHRAALGMVPTMISWVQSKGISHEAIAPDSHSHVSSQGILSASVGGSEHSFGGSMEFRFIWFFHT